MKFGNATLDEMVRDQEGIIVAENLSSFAQNRQAAWTTRLLMRRVQLFLLDFDYLMHCRKEIGGDDRLTKYLASMFCYGGACSLENVVAETCETRVVIISDGSSTHPTCLFPPFVSWVHNPFLVGRGIPISDPKSITFIIRMVKERVACRERAEDGDRKMVSFKGDSD